MSLYQGVGAGGAVREEEGGSGIRLGVGRGEEGQGEHLVVEEVGHQLGVDGMVEGEGPVGHHGD